MMIVQANTINYVHMHVFRKRKEKQLLELKDSEVLCELCFRKRKYKQEMKPAEKAKFYASKRNEG